MPEMVYVDSIAGPYGRLRDLIVRGRLAPGTPLVEAEAAQHLGVSRTPVREALQRLRRDGLAVTVGGGSRPRLAVAPMSRSSVEEVYRATGALEGVASRIIADRSSHDRIALARSLTELHQKFRRAAATRDTNWDELFERHDAFHRELRIASAGAHIHALLDVLRPQVDRYEWLFAPLTGPDFSATHEEHDAIVAAVRDGTADDLEGTVRANWFNGGDRLASVIERADGVLLTGGGWAAAARTRQ